MPLLDIPTVLEATAGIITALGSAYPAISHFRAKSRKNKENYRKEILDKAKNDMEIIEKSLDNKINLLAMETQTLKLGIYKDFNFFKETHTNEVRALSEKIELLRTDLSQQHTNLVNLLTKLVDNR